MLFLWAGCGILKSATDRGDCGAIGNENNVHWSFDSSSGELVIDGKGDMASYVPIMNAAPWKAYESNMTSVVIQEGVTSIGEYAFDQIATIKTVHIPHTITYISPTAFIGCSGILSLYWDNRNIRTNPFSDRQLTFIRFGTHIDTIPDSFCKDMTTITKVEISDSVRYVGRDAFYGCSALNEISVGKSVKDFGYNAFYRCNSLENVFWNSNVYTDWNPFFYVSTTCCCGKTDCGTVLPIKTLIFGDAVEQIPSEFCDGICRSLTSVVLGANVRKIGSYAFADCEKLEELVIPDKVDSIYSCAFADCGINKLTIGKNISYIASGAFRRDKIKHLTWNAKYCKPNYGQQNYILSWWDNDSIETIVIGPDVDTIPGGFGSYSKIEAIIIPDNVKVIERQAFEQCSKLHSLYIGRQVDRIDSLALSYCGLLDSIIIPDNVRELGYGVLRSDTIDYIYIGSGLKNIKDKALTRVHCKTMHWNIPKCNENIKSWPHDCQTLILGDQVKEVPDQFVWCNNTSLIIPDGVESIGIGAIMGGDSLTSISIGKGLKNLSASSFNLKPKKPISIYWNAAHCDMNNLNYYDSPWSDEIRKNTMDFTLGKDVRVIPAYICYGFKIKSLTIPDGVQTIEKAAFFSSALNSVSMPNSVIKIGEEAFYRCDSLRQVTLSEQLTELPILLFAQCTALSSVKLPEGLKKIGGSAFWYCTALNAVNIPSSIDTIESGAFEQCYSLTSLSIPDEVEYIGNNAFGGIPHIQYHGNASWGWGEQYWGARYMNGFVDSIFIYEDDTKQRLVACARSAQGHLDIPDHVKYIGRSVFMNCDKLTSVYIPGSVESIGYQAFHSCTSLKNVVFDEGVQSLGSYLFKYCDSLESVTFPLSLESIGSGIFYWSPESPICRNKDSWDDGILYYNNWAVQSNIDSLNKNVIIKDSVVGIADNILNSNKIVSIRIPNSLKYMCGNYYSCDSLNAIYINDLSNWCNIKFGYATPLEYAHNLYVNDTLLTNLDIPEGVKEINAYAFAGDTNIIRVSIPTTIDTCGNNAFYGCDKIEKVQWNAIHCKKDFYTHEIFPADNIKKFTFGKQVQDIPSELCKGMVKLDTIHLYDQVKNIGESTFEDCNLEVIICEAKTPPGISYESFAGSYNALLYVPAESIQLYKEYPDWNLFDIYPIGLVPAHVDSANVEVFEDNNSIIISWQVIDNAHHYEINIMEDEATVYSLIFDTEGHLTDYKNNTKSRLMHMAAEPEINGWQYTINDLKPNTYYTYNITAFSSSDNILLEYTGSFTMPMSTDIYKENLTIEKTTINKVLRNGQLLILRGDKTYTLQGQEVK